MNIEDIIHDVADTLKENETCKSVPILEEDKGNVLAKLDIAIAQQSLAIVVGWNGFSPQIGGKTAPGESPFGGVTVVVQVFEKPIINRTNEANPHLLTLAQEIAKALDGAASEGMDDALHLKKISPISEIGEDVITCDVEFETKATL